MSKDYNKFCIEQLVKLSDALGYVNVLLTSNGLAFLDAGGLWHLAMLNGIRLVKATTWKDAAEKIAKHLADGKQMFIDKIITKDTEGVAEFLIEMALRV